MMAIGSEMECQRNEAEGVTKTIYNKYLSRNLRMHSITPSIPLH